MASSQILYGLPVSVNKLDDLSTLWDEIAPLGAVIRVLIDHPDQVQLLNEYEKTRPTPRRWSVFVKIDAGYQCVNLFGMWSTFLLTREVERDYHRNIRCSKTCSTLFWPPRSSQYTDFTVTPVNPMLQPPWTRHPSFSQQNYRRLTTQPK